MKNTIVVVADLGCFKAYHIENNHLDRTPRLELIQQFDNPEAHGKLVDRVSDLGGRFPRRTAGATAAGAMSDGERHNIELEQRKRLVRQMATKLNTLGREAAVERVLLAASREINHQLLDELEPRVKSKIEQNIAADLTKADRDQLLRQFVLLPRPPATPAATFARG